MKKGERERERGEKEIEAVLLVVLCILIESRREWRLLVGRFLPVQGKAAWIWTHNSHLSVALSVRVG